MLNTIYTLQDVSKTALNWKVLKLPRQLHSTTSASLLSAIQNSWQITTQIRCCQQHRDQEEKLRGCCLQENKKTHLLCKYFFVTFATLFRKSAPEMAMLMSPVQRKQWPNMYAPPPGKQNPRRRMNSENAQSNQQMAQLSKSQYQIRRTLSNRIFHRKRATSMPENLDAAIPSPVTKQAILQVRPASPRLRSNTITSGLPKSLAPIPELASAEKIATTAEPAIGRPTTQDSEAILRRQLAAKRIQELKHRPSLHRRRSISDSELIERMRKKLEKCEADDTEPVEHEPSKLKKIRRFFMRIRKSSH